MSIRIALVVPLLAGPALGQYWDHDMELAMRAARPAQALLQPGVPGSGGAIVLADRRVVRSLDRATALLEDENYADAATLLQAVLDSGEDAFFHPEDQPKSLYRSVKAEATRLIGAIPADKRRGTYELEFGAVAERLYDEAIKSGDVAKLAEVARRFLHTPSGYDAQYRLGVWHFDQGRILAAAICFDRLAEIPEAADRFEPVLSLRRHAAFVATGDAERANELAKSLRERFGDRRITFGGREYALRDEAAFALLRERFVDPARDPTATDDWTTVRGGPTRSGLVAFRPDDEAITWSRSTVVDPFRENPTDVAGTDLTKRFDGAIDRLAGQLAARTPLPSGQPIVIGDRVIVRTTSNLRIHHLDTGDVRTEMFAEQALEDLAGADGQGAINDQSFNNYVTQRVWGDANQGTFSSDGRRVYVVEDAGPALPAIDPKTRQYRMPSRESRLLAYDLSTGRIVWEIGGPKGDFAAPLAGTFFLGAPLPLAGRLFCVVEVDNEVQLLVLEPRTERGRERVDVAWSQPLAAPNVDLTRDAVRRTSGLAVTYADGVLVCPTGAGIYVAVDVSNRTLLWARKFDATPGAPVPPFPGPFPVPPPNAKGGWKDDVVVAGSGRVLLTPRTGSELYCVDLRTGRDKWEKPVQRGDGLYVAGVANGRAVVVGVKSVQAIRLEDGKPAWKKPTALGTPAGRGFLSDGRAFLPLASNEVAIVDLASGEVALEWAAPGELGNLIPAGDRVVTQGTKGIGVFGLKLPELETASR